jgi:hypothetical protein
MTNVLFFVTRLILMPAPRSHTVVAARARSPDERRLDACAADGHHRRDGSHGAAARLDIARCGRRHAGAVSARFCWVLKGAERASNQKYIVKLALKSMPLFRHQIFSLIDSSSAWRLSLSYAPLVRSSFSDRPHYDMSSAVHTRARARTQGGEAFVQEKLDALLSAHPDTPVAAMWLQDWVGTQKVPWGEGILNFNSLAFD